MKFMAWLNWGASTVMFVVVALWAGWLWQTHKTAMDYVTADALQAPKMPFCRWLPVTAPEMASIGLDTKSRPVWTYARTALIAFHTGTRKPWYVDVGVIAIAGTGVTMSADGSPSRPVSRVSLTESKTVRLLPAWNTRDGLHVVRVDIANPLPPHEREKRWLGIAISGIRVCDSLDGSAE